MEKMRRKQRYEFDHARQAAPFGAGSSGDGASGRSDLDDLSRFEGEGGPAGPEPVALKPAGINSTNRSKS